MVDELLCKGAMFFVVKNHGNTFEFSHEELCPVVHQTIILMEILEIAFWPFPWRFTTN